MRPFCRISRATKKNHFATVFWPILVNYWDVPTLCPSTGTTRYITVTGRHPFGWRNLENQIFFFSPFSARLEKRKRKINTTHRGKMVQCQSSFGSSKTWSRTKLPFQTSNLHPWEAICAVTWMRDRIFSWCFNFLNGHVKISTIFIVFLAEKTNNNSETLPLHCEHCEDDNCVFIA